MRMVGLLSIHCLGKPISKPFPVYTYNLDPSLIWTRNDPLLGKLTVNCFYFKPALKLASVQIVRPLPDPDWVPTSFCAALGSHCLVGISNLRTGFLVLFNSDPVLQFPSVLQLLFETFF